MPQAQRDAEGGVLEVPGSESLAPAPLVHLCSPVLAAARQLFEYALRQGGEAGAPRGGLKPPPGQQEFGKDRERVQRYARLAQFSGDFACDDADRMKLFRRLQLGIGHDFHARAAPHPAASVPRVAREARAQACRPISSYPGLTLKRAVASCRFRTARPCQLRVLHWKWSVLPAVSRLWYRVEEDRLDRRKPDRLRQVLHMEERHFQRERLIPRQRLPHGRKAPARIPRAVGHRGSRLRRTGWLPPCGRNARGAERSGEVRHWRSPQSQKTRMVNSESVGSFYAG